MPSFDLLSWSKLDILAGVSLLILPYWYWRKTTNHALPLPPSPPSSLISNSMKGLPRFRAWETYNRWSKELGDIMLYRTLTHNIIILNSPEAIFELLDRRSSIYSSRPQMVMFHQLLNFPSTAFMEYGPQWKTNRKIFNQQLNSTASKNYQIYQSEGARDLLSMLASSPENFYQHCRHYAAGIVMNLAYGRKIAREQDDIVTLIETTSRGFSQASQPGFFMVDNIPILKYLPEWLPGAGFKKFARVLKEKICRARDIPFEEVKVQMNKGIARPSFVSSSLTDLGTDDEEDEGVQIIKYIAVGMFGAGAATTTSSLLSFILAMIMFPEVQAKGQEELDRVIGNSRLPQFEDRPNLPYTSAITQEVLRWFPVSPSSLPHVLIEDDQYGGYHLPKGSIVIPNAWNVLHDPRVYADPDHFKPERFIPDENGKIDRDPLSYGAFGFGRRICPGRHLADASIFIAVAYLLSTFNITAAIDENGNKIDVTHAFQSVPGILNHPRLFKCKLEPRSAQAKQVIMEATLAS